MSKYFLLYTPVPVNYVAHGLLQTIIQCKVSTGDTYLVNQYTVWLFPSVHIPLIKTDSALRLPASQAERFASATVVWDILRY